MRIAVLLVAAAGCTEPVEQASDVDSGLTRWQPVVASDGALLFALEPRFVHRIEHGVFVEGWQNTVVGPTLIVDGSGVTLATLAMGVMATVDLPSRMWVLQQDLTTWQGVWLDPAPRTPFAHATLFDRTTRAIAPTVALVPPIEEPVALGDELLDVPTTGGSDVARDIEVRRRLPDGTATTLYAARGFAVATWTRGEGGPGPGHQLGVDGRFAARIVVIRHDAGEFTTNERTMAGARLDPAGIACDATTAHMALGVLETDGTARVHVLDTTTLASVLDADGVRPPLALRSDGAAVAAVRAVDNRIMLISETTVETDLIAANTDAPPVIAGELALFKVDTGRSVLDLESGALGPSLDGSVGIRVTLAQWTAGAGFAALGEGTHSETSPDVLTALRVLTSTATTNLPRPPLIGDPRLTRVYGDFVYVSAHTGDDYRVYGYDLAAGALVSEHELPRCSEERILAMEGCR